MSYRTRSRRESGEMHNHTINKPEKDLRIETSGHLPNIRSQSAIKGSSIPGSARSVQFVQFGKPVTNERYTQMTPIITPQSVRRKTIFYSFILVFKKT